LISAKTMENDSELKAGHPPAVKVGGVRIVQHKNKEEKEVTPPKPSTDDVAAYGEDRPVKPPSVIYFKNKIYTSFYYKFIKCPTSQKLS